MNTIHRRIRAGLCRDCGLVPPVAGVARCQPCREAQNARAKAYAQKKRASGHAVAWVKR